MKPCPWDMANCEAHRADYIITTPRKKNSSGTGSVTGRSDETEKRVTAIISDASDQVQAKICDPVGYRQSGFFQGGPVQE